MTKNAAKALFRKERFEYMLNHHDGISLQSVALSVAEYCHSTKFDSKFLKCKFEKICSKKDKIGKTKNYKKLHQWVSRGLSDLQCELIEVAMEWPVGCLTSNRHQGNVLIMLDVLQGDIDHTEYVNIKANELLEIDGVDEVMRLTGNFDLLVSLNSHEVSHINEKINEISACVKCKNVHTCMVLGKAKRQLS